jgi:hypothetical protein
VSVHPDQLAFDFDALVRLFDQLHARRRIETGAPRLLEALVKRGLDERALVSAAALVLELDRPKEASVSHAKGRN